MKARCSEVPAEQVKAIDAEFYEISQLLKRMEVQSRKATNLAIGEPCNFHRAPEVLRWYQRLAALPAW